MAIDLEKHVERSIARALAGESKLPDEALFLEGMSSPTFRHFLNNLCDFRSANYLEIGTHKGSTLIAAAYRNPGRFAAVDNFSEFGHSEPRKVLMETRKRFRRDCDFTFHDSDCWSASLLRRLPPGVNVYFYDGAHGYQDHYNAFVHYDTIFANRFVALVDDWNWPKVREGTRDAFAHLGYTTVFERQFRTRRIVSGKWWNGLLVAVMSKRRRRGPAARS